MGDDMHEWLRRLLEEQGPVGQPIAIEEAGDWPRVIVRVEDLMALDTVTTPASLAPRLMIRAAALAGLLVAGTTVSGASAWAVVDGPEAATILPALSGIVVEGSTEPLPLTPLFAHARVADGKLVNILPERDEPPPRDDVPVTLVEPAPTQRGFLGHSPSNWLRVVPLDARYDAVVRTLSSGIVVTDVWPNDGATGADVVSHHRFAGRTPAGEIVVYGSCVFAKYMRLAHGPGGGIEHRAASWLVAGPKDGPFFLVPPADHAELSIQVLSALLLHVQ